jgi:hypothetical protein
MLKQKRKKTYISLRPIRRSLGIFTTEGVFDEMNNLLNKQTSGNHELTADVFTALLYSETVIENMKHSTACPTSNMKGR